MQFIVLIVCIIVITLILNREGPYQNEVVDIINSAHPNQKVVEWKEEDLDGCNVVTYRLKQQDGLDYNVVVQYYESQDTNENENNNENKVDILDGYLDTYIKQGDGRKEIENLVKSLSSDEYTLLYDGDDLVGIEIYNKDSFDSLCNDIYNSFDDMLELSNSGNIDTKDDSETLVDVQYGINCNFVIQYIDNTKQGYGSADVKQLIDLEREYDTNK